MGLTKRETHLNCRYSLSVAQYDEMYARQDGVCAICRMKPLAGGRRNVNAELMVDHCHATGDIRGLLCYHCNTVLGMSRDSIAVLERAITYLRSDPTYRKAELQKPRSRGWQQRAKTHCANGHPYDEKNTYILKTSGHRQCRVCRAEQSRLKYWRKKARAA